MTATDKAFIRVFSNGHADGANAYAPHVSFATHRSSPAAFVDMPHEAASDGRTAFRGCNAAAGPVADSADSAPEVPAGRHHQEQPQGSMRAKERPPVGNSAATYLPSLYRNLVGVEETPEMPRERIPTAPAAEPKREQPSRMSQRRPLAEVVEQTSAPTRFRPALEVDALRWGSAVDELLTAHRASLNPLGDALARARAREEQIIIFHSTASGIGCTTLALAAARLLAESDFAPVVVDANFLKSGLANAVGLAVEDGWETSFLSGGRLEDAVIHSLQDRISIVPLAGPLDLRLVLEHSAPRQVARTFRMLAHSFDIVLVDAGVIPEATGDTHALRNLFETSADGAVLIYGGDCPDTSYPQSSATGQTDLSLPLVGVIESFAA